MKLVLLLAWRHLWLRPGKTLASILGIAVGIATVVSVLVVDHNTLQSQQGIESGEPGADLLVQPQLDASVAFDQVAADLAAEPLLANVVAFASGTRALALAGRIVAGVELLALQSDAAAAAGAYVLDEGSDLDPSQREPQLLLPRALAERVGLSVGDLVDLTQPRRGRAPVVRCEDGRLVPDEAPRGPRAAAAQRAAEPEPTSFPFRVVGLLAPTRLGFAENRVLSTLHSGLEVLGRAASVRFWADMDTTATNLAELNQRLGDRYVLTSPKRSLTGLAPEEAAFRSGVRFCGFLALFLGLFIIFHTMSMSLVERVRAIGLLRALGLARGRLLAVFLAEGLVLASLGAGLSLVLARGIVAALEALRITTLGFGRPLVVREVPWGPVTGVVAAGMVFCLLGVLYPFVRAARLSVIDALRRGVIELSQQPFAGARRSVLLGVLALLPVAWVVAAPPDEYLPRPLYEALLLGLALVGSAFALLLLVPGLLAALARGLVRPWRGPAAALTRATLSAARQRVFGTVAGLMLVFAAIFLIVSVLESLKAEAKDFGARALDGRLFLEATPEGVARLPELRACDPALAGLAFLGVETTSTFLVRAIDSQALAEGSLAGDPAARRDFAAGRTLILSTRCADDFGKASGDIVRMLTRASRTPLDFRVLAVSDEFGFVPDDRSWAVVSQDTMRNDWCLDERGAGGFCSARVDGLEQAAAAALRARVEEILGAEHLLDWRRGEEITASYVADLERDFGIFYAILLLTVLLAAVGVLNAMGIAVLERRREIGLLRAVGLGGGQVAGMLLLESGVLGVLGGLLGLALGIPLALVTTDALVAMSHLELTFALSGRAVAAVLGGALVVSLLAVTLPALRANRLRLSDLVRYE